MPACAEPAALPVRCGLGSERTGTSWDHAAAVWAPCHALSLCSPGTERAPLPSPIGGRGSAWRGPDAWHLCQPEVQSVLPGAARGPGSRLHAGVTVPGPVCGRAGGLWPRERGVSRGTRQPLPALSARLAPAPRRREALRRAGRACGRRGHRVAAVRTCGAGIAGNPLIRGSETESTARQAGWAPPLERPQAWDFHPPRPGRPRAEGTWRPEPPAAPGEGFSAEPGHAVGGWPCAWSSPCRAGPAQPGRRSLSSRAVVGL